MWRRSLIGRDASIAIMRLSDGEVSILARYRKLTKAGVIGLAMLTLAGGLAGCSSNKKNQYVQGSIEYLYNLGYRSEEHTSELQSLMRISYAVFCLKKKN